MNNVLDGGINSPIRHLSNCHRGTNFTDQQKIVEIYLLKRSMFWNKISMLLNSENQLFLRHSSKSQLKFKQFNLFNKIIFVFVSPAHQCIIQNEFSMVTSIKNHPSKSVNKTQHFDKKIVDTRIYFEIDL